MHPPVALSSCGVRADAFAGHDAARGAMAVGIDLRIVGRAAAYLLARRLALIYVLTLVSVAMRIE